MGGKQWEKDFCMVEEIILHSLYTAVIHRTKICMIVIDAIGILDKNEFSFGLNKIQKRVDV